MRNRAERRAIAQGKGRHHPMVEIVDIYSAFEYQLDCPYSHDFIRMTDARTSMFIAEQFYLSDLNHESIGDDGFAG